MKTEITWIPCTDRLPDDEQTVLVAYEGEAWMGYHDRLGWMSLNGELLKRARVTHWADLPEVPT